MIATGLAGGADRARGCSSSSTRRRSFTTSPGSPSESRTNLAVIDPTSGEQTEINERGPEVSAAGDRRLLEGSTIWPRARICVLAGSLPPGVEPSIYARLISELRRRGRHRGARLRRRADARRPAAGPSVVTPNEREAEEARRPRVRGARGPARARKLLELGAGEAIITRPGGLRRDRRRADRRRCYGSDRAPGAGRRGRLGGRLPGRVRGGPLRRRLAARCLAYGVACGAESTQHSAPADRPERGRAASRESRSASSRSRPASRPRPVRHGHLGGPGRVRAPGDGDERARLHQGDPDRARSRRPR